MKTSIAEFEKATQRLNDALEQPKTEFLRDSVIQRFEFSIELAWKTAKKIMGTHSSAPKDIIREMGQSGYIVDVETWLEAIDMRNLSSHTYREELAEKVYDFAKRILPQIQDLVRILSEKVK